MRGQDSWRQQPCDPADLDLELADVEEEEEDCSAFASCAFAVLRWTAALLAFFPAFVGMSLRFFLRQKKSRKTLMLCQRRTAFARLSRS